MVCFDILLFGLIASLVLAHFAMTKSVQAEKAILLARLYRGAGQ
jgi:hypothetical protein